MLWFRMYSEFAYDPKVQSMSEILQRRLVMLFCFQGDDSLSKLTDDEIAFALRISINDLLETKEIFIKKGFLNDKWEILNWNKRQYKSDSSTERTRKWRKENVTGTSRERHSDENVTPPDTDTDTDKRKQPSSKDDGYSQEFLEFWKLYPRKTGKGGAYKAWKKIKKPKTTLTKIQIALIWQKKSDQWIRDNGQYIPHPSTYLNQCRWEDEQQNKEIPKSFYYNFPVCPHCGINGSNVIKGERCPNPECDLIV